MSLTTPDAVGWPGLLRHPNFRRAVEANAGQILAAHDRKSATARWLTNDLGRSSTLIRALILQGTRGEVSVGDVLARVRVRNTVSAGRVLRLLNRAQAVGWILVSPETGPWKDRRITFLPDYLALYRERAAIEIASASLVAPELGSCVALLEDDRFFRAFAAGLAGFDGMRPEAHGPANPSVRLFIEAEAGLMILYDLLLAQPKDRAELMEETPLSRARISKRFGVSRIHVGRLLAAAEAAGHLSLPSRARVKFSQAMSEETERHFALTFQAMKTSALSAAKQLATTDARQSG